MASQAIAKTLAEQVAMVGIWRRTDACVGYFLWQSKCWLWSETLIIFSCSDDAVCCCAYMWSVWLWTWSDIAEYVDSGSADATSAIVRLPWQWLRHSRLSTVWRHFGPSEPTSEGTYLSAFRLSVPYETDVHRHAHRYDGNILCAVYFRDILTVFLLKNFFLRDYKLEAMDWADTQKSVVIWMSFAFISCYRVQCNAFHW